MIIFTKHALLKLKQRGISKETVAETLKFPDYTCNSYSERKIAYKKFDKLYLKVVYKIEDHDIIVITQYWTEKIKLTK
jgi:SOS response regulatory protein OraA/RecX